MIKEVTKRERDRVMAYQGHARFFDMHRGRTFMKYLDKYYETTGHTGREIREFQKQKRHEDEVARSLQENQLTLI